MSYKHTSEPAVSDAEKRVEAQTENTKLFPKLDQALDWSAVHGSVQCSSHNLKTPLYDGAIKGQGLKTRGIYCQFIRFVLSVKTQQKSA